ncbi:MAG TPA: TonB-dependent receptor [Steroidobacteraceae bacterium]|nr:TonB-dependent receptor [Steroidobacteraceae bacterium]
MPRLLKCAVYILLFGSASAAAQTDDAGSAPGKIGEIVVAAPYGYEMPRDRVPANVQTATAAEITNSQALDLTDFMNHQLGSVNINDAQNNPLQPDVNFRGFTASPLLGLAQGLAVYQNGVRINEPFGDAVNWDLIPLSAIDSLQLFAGANPVFGLNTLGGSLSLQMKNGFNFQGGSMQAYGGSFGRRAAWAEYGGNNGEWGYYGDVDYFAEDGWRPHSDSDALRFYGAIGRHADNWSLDLSAAYANTELRGNGPTPVELLAIDREALFTFPDITENDLGQLELAGELKLSDTWTLGGNAYYRSLDTDTFNGDSTNYEECDVNGEELLVDEGFTDVNGDGACSSTTDTDIEPVHDLNGATIPVDFNGEELNAINNIGRRNQDGYGASVQISQHSGEGAGQNDFVAGAAYNVGETEYHSIAEVASLTADRATTRTGIFAAESDTRIDSRVRTSSLYFTDTFNVSARSALTVSGRYDDTEIRLADRSGANPELDGTHDYSRFNPAAGMTFKLTPAITAFASYSESTRAPSAVELACASEDAPCNLPNAFLADPPLEQVVAKSVEMGLDGKHGHELRWHLGAFRTINHDDILFQTTGGAQANVGFFSNVGNTRRAGVELNLSQHVSRVSWSLDYTYLEATFEDGFTINSPNHPVFEDDPAAPQIVGEDKLQVSPGASIPGLPRHIANASVDYAFNEHLSIGLDGSYRSGVFLRGDEVNLLDKTPSYTVFNLRGEYRFGDSFAVFARIENLFDQDYETFGLLGEPQEVFPTFTDPRFLGAAPPFGAWVGVRFNLK